MTAAPWLRRAPGRARSPTDRASGRGRHSRRSLPLPQPPDRLWIRRLAPADGSCVEDACRPHGGLYGRLARKKPPDQRRFHPDLADRARGIRCSSSEAGPAKLPIPMHAGTNRTAVPRHLNDDATPEAMRNSVQIRGRVRRSSRQIELAPSLLLVA